MSTSLALSNFPCPNPFLPCNLSTQPSPAEVAPQMTEMRSGSEAHQGRHVCHAQIGGSFEARTRVHVEASLDVNTRWKWRWNLLPVVWSISDGHKCYLYNMCLCAYARAFVTICAFVSGTQERRCSLLGRVVVQLQVHHSSQSHMVYRCLSTSPCTFLFDGRDF